MIATLQNTSEQSAGILHAGSAVEVSAANLTEVLIQAVELHQEGQWQQAENLYREILEVDPAQPNANHNLGVLSLDADLADESLVYFKTALANDADEPQFWVSYVGALIKSGLFDQARDVLMNGLERGLHGNEVNALVNQLCEPQAAQDRQNIKVKTNEPKIKTNLQIQQALALRHSGN